MPLSSVFRDRRAVRLKLLLWDGLGFRLLYRQLDQGVAYARIIEEQVESAETLPHIGEEGSYLLASGRSRRRAANTTRTPSCTNKRAVPRRFRWRRR